jgi:hypothetical protein
MPDISDVPDDFLFHHDISKVGDEWWLEIPWAIIVCNSRESAEEELDNQRKRYLAKLERMGNPDSVVPMIENGGSFYETGMSPPILTDESGKELPWT